MTATWENRITGSGMEDPAQLLANPFNFRYHPKEQQDALEGVLEEIGWIQDVIVNTTTGHLVDGHLRVTLAMRRGEQVPVKYVELSEREEKIALAAIDPISALATQDQGMLDDLVRQIGTVQDEQLQAFLDSLLSPQEEQPGETDDDDTPSTQAQAISRPGDIWILGNHRVMCGDGTNVDHVEALCDGEPIDMVWTDPPYNVNYEGKTSDALKIENDQMGAAQFRQFLRDIFTAAFIVTREGGPIYVAHADSEGVNFREAITEAGFLFKQCIIWVKNTMVLGRQDYQWQHEPILYGWKPGAAHKWYGEFNKKTVIDDTPSLKELDKSELQAECKRLRNALNASVVLEDKPSRSSEHPTMKPVGLILHMVRNSSIQGDTVLDLCGGSGSTMIAAQKLGRRARIMELDPRYCDVIVRRFQEYTGTPGHLESTGQAFDTITSPPVDL